MSTIEGMGEIVETTKVKGSTRKAEPGWAYIKDRCDGCNRIVYAYVPLDTPLDPPMCGKCKSKS